jgi:transketolase
MTKRLADHCGEQLASSGEHDPRLWVLDGDLADSDGAMHFAERHPARFLMAGIAEQNMVSVAAGMANAGLKPWVFSFAAFLCYRAYDQIRVCMSQARQPVVLVGSHAGGQCGRNGKTHTALNDMALMLSLPCIQVWSPGDFQDVDLAVRTLVERPLPAYLRLARRPFESGAALPGIAAPYRWLRDKRATTFVSTGIASTWALEAARILEANGLDVGLLHCLSLAPRPPLDELLGGVDRIFVVDDHYEFGGLAAVVQQFGLSARVETFGWPSDWSGKSGGDDELLESFGLSGPSLARTVLAKIGRRSAAHERR